jgi:nicotinamidase-related amidase
VSKTALLIINVQEAMYSYPNRYPFHGNLVLDNVKSLLERARASDVPVVFVQHTAKEEFTKGSRTWRICEEVSPREGEAVVEKPEWDAFHDTNLQAVLQEMGVTKLVVSGLQTELSIDTTCRRAFSMGYDTVLAEDAHTTFESRIMPAGQILDHHNELLDGRFVRLKTTQEILDSDFEV